MAHPTSLFPFLSEAGASDNGMASRRPFGSGGRRAELGAWSREANSSGWRAWGRGGAGDEDGAPIPQLPCDASWVEAVEYVVPPVMRTML